MHSLVGASHVQLPRQWRAHSLLSHVCRGCMANHCAGCWVPARLQLQGHSRACSLLPRRIGVLSQQSRLRKTVSAAKGSCSS